VSGAEVRNQNGKLAFRLLYRDQKLTYTLLHPRLAVLAAQTIANIVKSSLGPVGLDKASSSFLLP